MNYHLVLIALTVSTLAHLTNACQFGSEAIQAVYDRFELFRKTKAFDPTDPNFPLRHYQSYNDKDVKKLTLGTGNVYMWERFETDGDHKIQTKEGQYRVEGEVILNYKREENGEFLFDDWLKLKSFKSSLRSIDAKLPDDFEEDYKQVLVDLNAMRKKMFNFQNSKEDLEPGQFFEYSFSPRHGFSALYSDKDINLSVSQENESNPISGRLLCDQKKQKFNIVDGKVVVDGEPFVPV